MTIAKELKEMGESTEIEKEPVKTRKFTRSKLKNPLKGKILLLTGVPKECNVDIFSINMGGAHIHIQEDLRIGGHYRLKFNIPNAAKSYKLIGTSINFDVILEVKVVDSFEVKDANDQLKRFYGLSFVYLDRDRYLKNLSRFLNFLGNPENHELINEEEQNSTDLIV